MGSGLERVLASYVDVSVFHSFLISESRFKHSRLIRLFAEFCPYFKKTKVFALWTIFRPILDSFL